jgi:hypothetical protein
MDGIVDKETLMGALHKAKGALAKVSEVQRAALREKFASSLSDNGDNLDNGDDYNADSNGNDDSGECLEKD